MPPRPLPDFPDAFLTPHSAWIYGKPGEWAIIIPLKPFELDEETVETRIVLDAFRWDVDHPKDLAGSTHTYTREDLEDQGTEGSLYLRGAHNPVDVTKIAFGKAAADGIDATIEMEIDFDFEGGGFKNRPARIACRLMFDMPAGIRSFRTIE